MSRRLVRLVVALSWPSTSTVLVNYATANGTATAGSDYTTKSGLLTFLPRQTSKAVAFNVWPDQLVEGDETFTVALTNPVNATLGVDTGTATIIDDDPLGGPRVSIGDATVPESCAGHNVGAVVEITLSKMLAPPSEIVHVATVPVSATPGVDYVSVSKDFTITSGQDLKELTIPIIPDLLVEGPEQLQVNLTVLSGAAPLFRSVATVTILDCTA